MTGPGILVAGVVAGGGATRVWSWPEKEKKKKKSGRTLPAEAGEATFRHAAVHRPFQPRFTRAGESASQMGSVGAPEWSNICNFENPCSPQLLRPRSRHRLRKNGATYAIRITPQSELLSSLKHLESMKESVRAAFADAVPATVPAIVFADELGGSGFMDVDGGSGSRHHRP